MIWPFSLLFKAKAPAAPAVKPPEEEEELGVSAFLRNRLSDGMPVHVINESGEVLCTGRIIRGGVSYLTLGRLPGGLGFKQLEVGSEALLLAYNVDMVRVRVRAVVGESTATKLSFTRWELIDHDSKRDDPRLPLNVEAEIYSIRAKPGEVARKCRILDLSMNGARISTTEEFAIGDEFRLRFEVMKDDGVLSCHAQVVWAKSPDGNLYEYGLLFAELERWRRHALELSLKELKDALHRKTKS